MIWDSFIIFALPFCILGIAGSVSVYIPRFKWLSDMCMMSAVILLGIFIALLWHELERPPLRTMGETRLWYAFFLSFIGYITYKHWKYRWLLGFSMFMAILFVLINYFKPEIHSKNLMPALQSFWFIPHVSIYIFSYATLGAATIAALVQIFMLLKKQAINYKLVEFIDNIIYIGFAFLTFGMLLGAIWAKEAWGHYWSWDPKETWAFITACAYLIYIHIRLRKKYLKTALFLLPFAFLLLMIAWIGVNYLPSAQSSIHTYAR
ncbi:cytochrome c biogenesis protein CcsA [Apibacter raozihei]|uniref:cytochrome c biogenesis protein CcsA n=1 Tax=Apibacter raozihei TaxID=2500547 RepID=UPI000FE36CAA|nr:cytochrome c biogenesis protein CcsA [Apibacter raozihei]